MNRFKIALYPGDGIGKEVMDACVTLLEALEKKDGGFSLEMTGFPWSVDYYEEHGRVTAEDYLEQLKGFDAILLGALGDPSRVPDHEAVRPLLEIRQRFDQYAGVRPACILPGMTSPIVGKGEKEIDFVIIRENSEGEYIDMGGVFKHDQPDEFALQTAVHSRKGIERILRYGFELAQKRRKKLTLATKSNVLRYGMVLWDKVLEEVKGDYPDVEAGKQYVDAAAMNFIRQPETFDVVVASNLFGDILSDIGGVLSGSLGLIPSACINAEKRYPSMFEPVHGSAPDIAGQGIANPVAMFLSAAMMLEFLDQDGASQKLNKAVHDCLEQGERTGDIGGNLNTQEMTKAVIARL